MGKTVEFGVNVTRDIVGAKVGAIRSAAELVRKEQSDILLHGCCRFPG